MELLDDVFHASEFSNYYEEERQFKQIFKENYSDIGN